MKTLNIVTAILLNIKSFGSDPFSIYDITKSIRLDVADESYELSDFGDLVEHETVKENFLELLENGLLDSYTVSHNPAGYREYQVNDGSSPSPQQTATVQPLTNIPTDVQLIIYKYMKNTGPVTMKQIQSRLKGHSYTCKDIKEFLEKINLIDTNSKNYPDSQKFTVAI
jgi:hypothetical protein